MRAAALFLAGAIVGAATAASPVFASDFMHQCRSADGRYEVDDDQLSSTADPQRREIKYQVVSETVMSERRGYCQARGRRYEFHGKTYVRRLRFVENGGPVETEVLCEFAADGLPAEYRCEKEVVTFEKKGPPKTGGPQDAAVSYWNHNGSLMRLEANGASRRFSYEQPRRGMVEVGARPGDAVFEGRRDGARYAGTAYIYNRECGRVAYPVAGEASRDERRVVLEGEAPLFNRDCTIRATKRDRLVFEYKQR